MPDETKTSVLLGDINPDTGTRRSTTLVSRVNESGLTELYRQGKDVLARVATGTADYINKVMEGQAVTPVISSEQGRKVVEDIQRQITPPPPPTTTETPQEPQSDLDKIATDQAKREAEAGMTEEQRVKAQGEEDKKARLAEFKAIFDPLLASAERSKQEQIAGITAEYESLINRQQDINRRSEAAFQTGLIRRGTAQFAPTHALDAQTAKIEEGGFLIADLVSKRQAAIARVQSAFADKQYEQGVKEFEVVRDANKEIDKQTEEIRKNIREANKEATKVKRELANDLYTQITKPINDIAVDAAKNGAPPEVQTAISSAKTVKEAIAAAGDYLQTTSGIVGEYLFYKRQAEGRGQVPLDFDTYQTRDQNRKIALSQAAIAGTQLNPSQQVVFNRIIDKFNASEAIKALDKAGNLRQIVENILKDPTDPAKQLNLVYSYIKGLDTDSAVREGEIDLVRSITSYLGKFQNAFVRISEGRPVDEKTARNIAEGATELIKVIEQTAKRKKAVFDAQAKQNGTAVYGAWKSFEESVNTAYTENLNNEIMRNEDESAVILQTYLDINPEKTDEVNKKIKEMEINLGRSVSAQEFLQTFPEYQ